MKIEIGEFLILSWLRHVRGCVVTQMNWSPSPAWAIGWARTHGAGFEAIRAFAVAAVGARILGDAAFASFIRAARIDVLGLRPNRRAGEVEAIAVDTAINDSELPHGDAE